LNSTDKVTPPVVSCWMSHTTLTHLWVLQLWYTQHHQVRKSHTCSVLTIRFLTSGDCRLIRNLLSVLTLPNPMGIDRFRRAWSLSWNCMLWLRLTRAKQNKKIMLHTVTKKKHVISKKSIDILVICLLGLPLSIWSPWSQDLHWCHQDQSQWSSTVLKCQLSQKNSRQDNNNCSEKVRCINWVSHVPSFCSLSTVTSAITCTVYSLIEAGGFYFITGFPTTV
jgi:hypothetical protein